MQEFRGRIAVITGGASGIGLAIAARAADEGMKLVLADIEQAALDTAASSLRGRGADVATLRVDVSSAADVEALANLAYDTYGAVHLLCNNAGVMNRERPTWEHTLAEWEWLLGVNVRGVVNGVHSFVPRMLAGAEEGHVINTASMAGIVTGRPGNAVYDATKHAVVSLTESLYRDLVAEQDRVSASVLCPGVIKTNIFTAERNRPASAGPAFDPTAPAPKAEDYDPGAFEPSRVADMVFDAVREDRFYILAAQDVIYEYTKMGFDRLLGGKNPAVPRSVIAARQARQSASQ